MLDLLSGGLRFLIHQLIGKSVQNMEGSQLPEIERRLSSLNLGASSSLHRLEQSTKLRSERQALQAEDIVQKIRQQIG